jgi:GT2 family glycosyltransferase
VSDSIEIAVIIPVKDDIDGLKACLRTLVPILPPDAGVLVIDDHSRVAIACHPALAVYLSDPRIATQRNDINLGPGASRNIGVAWARNRGAKLAIFLDADCTVDTTFIAAHRDLHRRHPDAVCCGGAIQGYGRGLWARLDGMMSWFTSLTGAPERIVRPPYHIPTTNMSVKIDRLPATEDWFNPRLRTGEDVAFIKKFWAEGWPIIFSPRPEVRHRDRETLHGFIGHQYRWGLHTYVVRRGATRLAWMDRLVFATMFLMGLPFYIVLATTLNMIPLLRRSVIDLVFLPMIAMVYAIKAIAVLHGTLNPQAALFPDRRYG